MTAEPQTKTIGLWSFVAEHKPLIERGLESSLPLAPAAIETKFNEAVRYAVFPGGKRLRPVLTMLGAGLFGGDVRDVVHAASAVELIHTSSLIFDDLPGMDNSAERRGQLSLHEKFGEGLATLVAIGFLNHSYALVMRSADRRRAADAVVEIVDCVGPAGMIGGQSVDLRLREIVECNTCSARVAGGMLNLKTSSLIRLALRLGAILSGAGDRELESLSSFAEYLGQAYQISDDIIDVGQDVSANGVAISVNPNGSPSGSLMRATQQAKSVLMDSFAQCEARECLLDLVDYIASREN